MKKGREKKHKHRDQALEKKQYFVPIGNSRYPDPEVKGAEQEHSKNEN